MEINIIKRTIPRKLRKGVNKKILKYYSYSKLGYFTKDYKLKNIVSKL